MNKKRILEITRNALDFHYDEECWTTEEKKENREVRNIIIKALNFYEKRNK
jgi:hypothetical protein